MARPPLLRICAVSLGLGTIVGGTPQLGAETNVPLLYVAALPAGLHFVSSLVTSAPDPTSRLRHLPDVRLPRSRSKARTGVLAIAP